MADYRNMAVHRSAVKRDEGMNIAKSDKPYYTETIELHDSVYEGTYIRFGIPLEFIINTLKNCIKNYKNECVENGVTPPLTY